MLHEFFIKTKRGWTHKRYLEELKRVNSIRCRNRENGKKGGRPPKLEEPSGNPVETDWVILGNPNETQNNQTLDSRLKTTTKTPLPPASRGGNGNGTGHQTHDELLKDEHNYSWMAWAQGHIVIRTGRHRRVLSKTDIESMAGCPIETVVERINSKGFWAEIYKSSGEEHS